MTSDKKNELGKVIQMIKPHTIAISEIKPKQGQKYR